MKKLATTFGVLAVLAMAAVPSFASNAVRISQVYGGGGSGTAGVSYAQDYVELFNNSGAAINIGGWTLEYGSATGTWGGSTSANFFTFPANTLIQPCKYLLVTLGIAGAAGAPLVGDFNSGAINMSGSNGKIALFSAPLLNVACGAELGLIVDKVAYGTATCPEVTGTAGLSLTTAAVRNGGGTVDTDSNVADFTIVTNPVPRNSASAGNPTCLATPTSKSTWGAVKSIYR